MHLATLAALSLAALSSACTIVVAGPADEADSGDETTAAASSFPEQAESSSTGELEVDRSSTGQEIASSTGEVEADDETSTGVETTGEIVGETVGETSGSDETSTSTSTSEGTTSGSTSTGDLSTIGDTGDETSSTTDPVPVGAALGETCTQDSDCISNVCIGESGFNDQPRCSTFCNPGIATDCLDLGSPGLCTWGGGNAHHCTGVFDFDAQDLRLATPDPDVEFLFYQNSGFLPTAADRHAYLVLPQQAAFYVEIGSVNDPGYGPVVVDVHASDGSLIGTFEQGDNPTIEPKGILHYHWLIVRPADDKKVSYTLNLKESCWPNC